MKPTVDLLLPGLFDRLSDWDLSYAEKPEAPFLSTLIRGAARTCIPAAGFERGLWNLLYPNASTCQELPVGRLLSGLQGQVVCRADPVYLRQGISDLVLVEGSQLSLEPDECRLLETLIDEYVQPVGGRFSWHQGAGYLALSDAPPLISTPLSEAAGEGINHRLPAGAGQRWWGRFLNELQMLLFNSEINALRESRRKLPINSLWLWGGGELPASSMSPHYDGAVTHDNTFAMAMVEASGIPGVADFQTGLAQGCQRLLDIYPGLLDAARYDDYAAWRMHLAHFDQQYLPTLNAALQRGEIGRLSVISGGWRFDIRRFGRYRFWRRPRSLAAFCQ